jgi:hypothetical protein
MCDPRPKYSVELPGCQLFFLTKLKSDCTLGLRPAGVNHIPRPALGVRFAPPPFPQRGTFCVAPEAYVFIRPVYLQKTKLIAVLLVTTGVPRVAHARPHARNIFLFV